MAKTPEKKFSARALKSWETRRKNAKNAKKAKIEAKKALQVWDDLVETSKPRSEVGPTADELLKPVRFSWDNPMPAESNASAGTDSPDRASTYTDRTEEIMKLARGKDTAKAQEAVHNHLMMMRKGSYFDGESQGQVTARRQMLEQRKELDEQIVCAWLAEVDYAMQAGNGGLRKDEAWILNSLLVTKIVDALNAAGYTAKGRRRT